MLKIFLLFILLILFLPFLILFLLFGFPPTRKLVLYFLNKKFEKMSKNGHVYYRTYHYRNGYQENSMRDVTPENIIDVTPISETNLRDKSGHHTIR